MKRIPVGVVVLAFILATLPAEAEVVGKTDAEVQGVAEPILDNLLAGFNEGDYQKYSRDFDATLKEALPENKFKAVRQEIFKKIGQYRTKVYLGALRQDPHSVALWKGKFSGTENDVLIRLVLSRRQDRTYVVGLWFQ
jgi:hypothetical protein